jgi:two-component system, response regulator
MMSGKFIVLAEDNPDDEELTRRAFKKNNVANEIVVVRDGVEALDFLFGVGTHAGRDSTIQPQVLLLDLNLPRLSGLDVLRRLRADERTRCLPVIVLTSSKQEEDVINSYSLGANAYVPKPVDFGHFVDAMRTLGLFWLVLNTTPPRRKVSPTSG